MQLEGQGRREPDRGYAMAALLVGMSVMAVLMSAALPVWTQLIKREKEAELIWRGEQYARAVMLFQRKFANAFPPSIDLLVEQKFLRKKYKDPITNDDFQPIPVGGQMPGQGGQQPGAGTQPARPGAPGQPGAGFGPPTTPGAPSGVSVGIQGVVSKSAETSIRIYNGRSKYNEWAFVAIQATQQGGGPGGPMQPRGPGAPPGNPGTFGPGGPGTQSPFGPGSSPFGPGGPGAPGGPARPPVFGPGAPPGGPGGGVFTPVRPPVTPPPPPPPAGI
ncbi:MAG: type II secretion system protein [Acidobacteriota bacterium]